MTAKKLAQLTTISNELLADSVVAVGSMIIDVCTDQIGQLEDAQILEGDGTGTNFTGVFTISGTGEVALGDAAVSSLDHFTAAERILGIASPRYLDGAAFVFSPTVWDDIVSLKHPGYSGDLVGDYMVDRHPAEKIPRQLLGYPVHLTNQISDARGTGTDESTGYFCNFKRAVIVGNRNAVTIARDPYTLLDSFQTRIVCGERIGIVVALPGACVKITGITT